MSAFASTSAERCPTTTGGGKREIVASPRCRITNGAGPIPTARRGSTALLPVEDEVEAKRGGSACSHELAHDVKPTNGGAPTSHDECRKVGKAHGANKRPKAANVAPELSLMWAVDQGPACSHEPRLELRIPTPRVLSLNVGTDLQFTLTSYR